MSAEQFGTNLRATAAISIPNLVRGCLPLIILPIFQLLRQIFKTQNGNTMSDGYVTGAWVTGIIIMTIGLVAVFFTKESFGKDMNFVEL
jgi:hypothetical protein